ncbi:MAG TPA: hypothetical protein VGH39_06525 [Xanthobacteraceae bacterium]
MRRRIGLLASAAVLFAAPSFPTIAQAQQASMSFFVTSVGKGNGADLGGLDGADAYCQALARAVGSTNTNWRAYLSTTQPGGEAGVSARDRIGKGPWQNAKGVVIAKSVEDLHSDSNNITKQTALTEKGETISGRGDPVNMHDVLTGSDPQGHFSTAGGDTTCGNWTKSGEGSAIVGHHDRMGLKDTWHMKSWNSAHGTRGCSQDALKSTGGAGLLYCFAAN